MQNDVYPKEYWEKEAKGEGFFAILSQEQYRDPKNFWASDAGLTPEVMNSLTSTTEFLDLGCGYGRIGKHIHSEVKTYIGVDFSAEMIQKAQKFHSGIKNIWFFQNNGINLSLLSDEAFDIVFSCLLFQHLPKETIFAYLDEAIRVCNPNGKLFIYNIPKSTIAKNGVTKEELVEAIKSTKAEVTEDKYYFHVIGDK